MKWGFFKIYRLGLIRDCLGHDGSSTTFRLVSLVVRRGRIRYSGVKARGTVRNLGPRPAERYHNLRSAHSVAAHRALCTGPARQIEVGSCSGTKVQEKVDAKTFLIWIPQKTAIYATDFVVPPIT